MFLKNYFFSKGDPLGVLTGIDSSLTGGLTSPLIVKITGRLSAFVVRVIVLVNFPTLFVAYLTPIDPLSPGFQVEEPSSFLHEGTVHPQLPLAFLITKGSEPELVNLNSLWPSELWSIIP